MFSLVVGLLTNNLFFVGEDINKERFSGGAD
jgi:hypothetical protein